MIKTPYKWTTVGFWTQNPLENTKTRKLTKQDGFEVLEMKNPKLVSDLKSDTDRKMLV